ncbi:MAG: PAS domain S-box protein [Verrucomicrobia bacterium]|nr:PAS domain S-box protein [Verrucomicrobiota bacterium]
MDNDKVSANKPAAISEELSTQACLYVTGAMTAEERAEYEAWMERQPALLGHTTELQEVATAVFLESLPSPQNPPSELKTRVLRSIEAKLDIEQFVSAYLQDPLEAALFTDAAGLVQWINPALTLMCGFTLDELRGRKPGSVLQGKLTDAASVARLRQAVASGTPCREELINYHKDGHPYWVAIAINPILGPDGAPRGFMAIESELKDRPIPVCV